MEDSVVLQVNMLGEFSLSYGEQTIMDQHSRSGKLWSFLEYLIAFHEKDISQNEIIELLWPEEDEITDPGNTLKTLLHRVRSLLGKLGKDDVSKSVVYRRGAYRFAPTVPCRIDVVDFDAYCKEAATAKEEQQQLDAMLRAIDLYKGDFLPRSALEPWVIPIHTYYRTQYIKVVYAAIAILNRQGAFDQVLSICRKAVTIDPYDEGLHLLMIKALLSTGAQRTALQHYQYVTDLFFTQFGVSPSEELTDLYKEVVKTEQNMELDLGIIKESLQENSPKHTAFFCEYAVFQEIYRLEARSALRTGQVIHVALMTVVSDTRKPLTQKQRNTAMERLKDVIGTALRRNDIYARYSVTQYLLMLPSANFENSQMVVNRVISTFRSQYPKTPIAIQYKVLPLDPVEMA